MKNKILVNIKMSNLFCMKDFCNFDTGMIHCPTIILLTYPLHETIIHFIQWYEELEMCKKC